MYINPVTMWSQLQTYPLNPNQKTPCHKWSHNHLCFWGGGCWFHERLKRGHARVHLADREWRQHWNWRIKLLKFSSHCFLIALLVGFSSHHSAKLFYRHCNPTLSQGGLPVNLIMLKVWGLSLLWATSIFPNLNMLQ